MTALLSRSPARRFPGELSPQRGCWLQRRCACGGTIGPDGECDACRKQRLPGQGAAGHAPGGPTRAPAIVHEILRGSGRPLDAATRAELEPHFGHDFSAVRIHADGRAAESARAVGALAYTVGRDVVFAAGHYRPGTAAGDRLIAHELAHVVQQGGRAVDPDSELRVAPAGDALERQAESASARGAGRPAATPAIPAAGALLQRAETTPAGGPVRDDDCSGWLKDHESTAKRAAEHYVRNEFGGQHGAVKKIDCDLVASTGAFGCTVWFDDGTPIRVIVRPDSIVVGKFPLQTMTPPADQPLCWYRFNCPGPNHDLILTKIKCQSAKAPPQDSPAGGSQRGPNP